MIQWKVSPGFLTVAQINTSTSKSGTWSCGQSPKWRTPFTDSKLAVAMHEALFLFGFQEVLTLVANSTAFFFHVITLLPLFNLEALQLQLPIFETRKLIHFWKVNPPEVDPKPSELGGVNISLFDDIVVNWIIWIWLDIWYLDTSRSSPGYIVTMKCTQIFKQTLDLNNKKDSRTLEDVLSWKLT